MKKFFLLLFFFILGVSPAFSEEIKLKKHEISRDIAKELTAIFHDNILDFFPVKEKFPDFFAEVQKQMPEQQEPVELLEIYAPNSARQDLERGHFDNITSLIYFYRMPQIMHKNMPLQRLQLAFVKESLEAVYKKFEKIDPPSLKEHKVWEENMYQHLLARKNVYIQYKKEAGALNHKYSIMLTLPLSESHTISAFMAHYPFLSEGQIYFLSSSAYLLDNNYYGVLNWTRNTLDTFIEIIPHDMFPSNDEKS